MYEVFHGEHASHATEDVAAAFKVLAEKHPEERHVILRLTPEDGSFVWVDDLQHDLAAAMRSFRYLAEKLSATYDASDSRGQKSIASIGKHLATVEALKAALVDKILSATDPAP